MAGMTDVRAVVVSRAGRVERVFLAVGNDGEFQALRKALVEEYELEVDVRVLSSAGFLRAGTCAGTVGEIMQADAIEEEAFEEGDVELLQAAGLVGPGEG